MPFRLALIFGFVCLVLPAGATAQLRFRVYISGVTMPVGMVQDPSDAAVQYVLEQRGRIRVIKNGVLQSASFLDLTDVVRFGAEQGLLGLAFPPDYSSSGRFYVNFTNASGHTVIARFRRSAGNPLAADVSSRFDLRWPSGLRYIEQPDAGHNGGKILFAPDGYLYIGMGDGGAGHDLNAQDPTTLLGKMLRIDVAVADNDPEGYRVPLDNPFVANGAASALGEMWAFGLRNPWRFTVDDPARGGTGAILIADVGQSRWEEIDYQPPGAGGRNYGWRNREGAHDYITTMAPAYGPLVEPLHEYGHSFGYCVIGGHVYRGTGLGQAHVGRYFFGDTGGRIASLGFDVDPVTGEATSTGIVDHTSELGGRSALGTIVSIDVDAAGELYIVELGGRVLRIESAANDPADADRDGLLDSWERAFGLDPASATGDNGADGDPDNDGKSNVAEFHEASHPHGFHTRYLAEGAISDFFTTWVGLLNPGAETATVVVRILSRAGSTSQLMSVGGLTHRVFDPATLTGFERSGFSIAVESDRPMAAERTMAWSASSHYGSHTESGVESASTTWYFAEGATHSGLDLFYLIQNANARPANITVTYLRPAPLAAVVKRYVVQANSRSDIWVNVDDSLLADTDVAAVMTSDLPIVVERAVYRTTEGRLFDAGHASTGVTAARTRWFLAEGATGDFFDLFIPIANPSPSHARVVANYLLPDGSTVEKTYVVPAYSRFTIWVDREDERLADAAVSTSITSIDGVPIVVERTMWWPGPTAASWQEAHVAGAAHEAGTRWATAGGEVGGADNAETYLLIANTSSYAGTARVVLVLEDGRRLEKTFALNPTSRLTVAVLADFPDAAGSRFGAIVESVGSMPASIVVERATYSDAGGIRWAAGASTTAARLQ
jgi:glucose/arabinose dehydrogenase